MIPTDTERQERLDKGTILRWESLHARYFGYRNGETAA
jgi:hypothetical protein